MSLDYKKYGVSEGFLPKIFFNRITLDTSKIAAHKYRSSIDAYIHRVGEEKKKDGGKVISQYPDIVEPDYNNLNADGKTILIEADTNLIFIPPSISEFKKLVSDDDFASSVKIYYSFFYSKAGVGTINLEDVPYPTGDAIKYTSSIVDRLTSDTHGVSNSIQFEVTMAQVFQQVKGPATDALKKSVSDLDMFAKYQKQFPDGTTYFQIPYKVYFNSTHAGFDSVQNIYSIAFCQVQDYEMELNLNFGDFEINDSSITMDAKDVIGTSNTTWFSSIGRGPVTVETILNQGKVPRRGAIYTISENQATLSPAYPLREGYIMTFDEGSGVYKIYGQGQTIDTDPSKHDIQREEKFNDLKGLPWFGSVHRHPANGRYMAGASMMLGQKDPDIHPFLNKHYIPSNKVIDLRVLKKLEESKIALSPAQAQTFKKTGIRYHKDTSKEHLMDKLAVISEPLLSTDPNGNVRGIFAIDYAKFLKKHSILGRWGFDMFFWAESPPGDDLNWGLQTLRSLLKNSLLSTSTIRIIREGPKSSKTIFDSAAPEPVAGGIPGVYYEYDVSALGYSTKPAGYLSTIDIYHVLPSLNDDPMVEFYTFSDLGEDKLKNVEYKYRVEVSFADPVFDFLANGLTLLDNVINGNGQQMGVMGLLKAIENLKGTNATLKGTSGTNNFSYIYVDLNNKAAAGWWPSPALKPDALIGLINNIDDSQWNPTGTPVSSLDNNNNLKVLTSLLDSKIVPLLVNSHHIETNDIDMGLSYTQFEEHVNAIFNLSDVNSLSVDLINKFIYAINSLRSDLRNILDGFSNVNFTKADSVINRSLGATKFSGNDPSEGRRRELKESKLSSEYIKVLDFGLDYTDVLMDKDKVALSPGDFSTYQTFGLKQIPYKGTYGYENTVRVRILERYLSKAVVHEALTGDLSKDVTPAEGLTVEKAKAINTIRKSGLSVIPLPSLSHSPHQLAEAIKLPERLIDKSDFFSNVPGPMNVANLLNVLLLFNRENLSKMDKNSIFSFNQIKKATKEYDYEINIEEGPMATNIGDNFVMLRSVERNQALLRDVGLDVQDKTVFNDTKVIKSEKDQQTGETKEIETYQTGYKTDHNTEHFLSFVNRAANVDKMWADTNPNYISKSPDLLTVPLLSLAIYGKSNDSSLLGKPGGNNENGDFDKFYKKQMRTWAQVGDSASSNQLVFSNYAAYFFEFINTVKVEYLKGFGTYDQNAAGEWGDFGDTPGGVAFALDSLNIGHGIWQKFHPSVIGDMELGQALLCRISNYAAPPFTMNKTRKELKRYPLFYKHFLIINGHSQGVGVYEAKSIGDTL